LNQGKTVQLYMKNATYDIWGSHTSKHSDDGHLGCDMM